MPTFCSKQVHDPSVIQAHDRVECFIQWFVLYRLKSSRMSWMIRSVTSVMVFVVMVRMLRIFVVIFTVSGITVSSLRIFVVIFIVSGITVSSVGLLYTLLQAHRTIDVSSRKAVIDHVPSTSSPSSQTFQGPVPINRYESMSFFRTGFFRIFIFLLCFKLPYQSCYLFIIYLATANLMSLIESICFVPRFMSCLFS